MSVVTFHTDMLGGTDAIIIVHTFGCGTIDACFFAGTAVGTAAIVTVALFKAVATRTGIEIATFFRVNLDGALFATAFLIIGASVRTASDFGHLIHSFL